MVQARVPCAVCFPHLDHDQFLMHFLQTMHGVVAHMGTLFSLKESRTVCGALRHSILL